MTHVGKSPPHRPRTPVPARPGPDGRFLRGLACAVLTQLAGALLAAAVVAVVVQIGIWRTP